jgi:integration host factor subunit beta
MTKLELVERLLARNPHLYERDIETIVNIVFGQIAAAMARDDRVELRAFGSFSIQHREARIGRNPRTGEVVQVSDRHYPYFRAGKRMHERLNQQTRAPLFCRRLPDGGLDGLCGSRICHRCRRRNGSRDGYWRRRFFYRRPSGIGRHWWGSRRRDRLRAANMMRFGH